MRKPPAITAFRLEPGTVLANKYEIIELLGAGWEGEVYLIRERVTKVERTAKLFYPHRNIRDKASKFYARKLHKLKQCPIIIQYHARELFEFQGIEVSVLISEFVEGEMLSEFLKRQKGRHLEVFEAIHLLHTLASGIECIHELGDYHGDLHSDNIIVQRDGLGFELKLLDVFQWSAPRKLNIQDDVIDLIKIFYEALGGQKHYAKQPFVVKNICCGLKRSLIQKKFRTAGQLKTYLEKMSWE